jgi:hypothetical protein
MAKPLQTLQRPRNSKIGLIDAILVEPRQQRLRKLAGEPDHILVFRLHTRPRLQYQPCDVGGQTDQQDRRNKQIEPRTEGKRLPHGITRNRATLTQQYTGSLIIYMYRQPVSERCR